MNLPEHQYLLPLTPGGHPDYHPFPGVWDEMLDPQGEIRAHWRSLVTDLEAMGAHELGNRSQRIKRLLRENGVTYHVYGDPRGYSRVWELDPLPLVLDGDDWRHMEAGVRQRARLLDLILRDLYGPQNLLKRGLLPPDLIYAHAGYLRPLLGSVPADRRQLIFYAADLARGPDGRVWVIADRTQSPSGAGYAVENRSVMARTFPELLDEGRAARLTGWLEDVQMAMSALAPAGDEAPSVVILTPGPANETYFEHAYLAARLGYTLVQGDDLTVRDGQVWLKTVAGLKRVDVILRRLDETWCDPLELRQDSALGTPGLVEAIRRGSVVVANPLGAGVLENPALMPFIRSLARTLLDEDLILPTAATWWCGQAKEREHVLANLPQLVIKPIHRGRASDTVFGSQLDRQELAAWRERILAHPYLYVGQEPLQLSSVPAVATGHLLPQRASLRTFLVAGHGDYSVMPGGLTRINADGILSGQSGALSKDTWVLVEEVARPLRTAPPLQVEVSLSSRSADHLYWTGRYLERAEAVAHLLRAVLDGLWEEETSPGVGPILGALMRLIGLPAAAYNCAEGTDLASCVRQLATRDARPGNLAHTVRALLGCTYATREYWSFAIWRLLDRVERDWGQRPQRRSVNIQGRTDLWLGHLIDSLAGLAGLASETLPREQAFRFFDLGRRIERALSLVTVLREVLGARLDPDGERECLALLLQSKDSLIGFRRRYRTEPFLGGALEMLLWNADSPRSLVYQLQTARHHLSLLPRTDDHGGADLTLLSAEARLLASEHTVADLLVDTAEHALLLDTLDEVGSWLRDVSDAITQTWFTHIQEHHPLRPRLQRPAA